MKTLLFILLLMVPGMAWAEPMKSDEWVPVCWEKAPNQPYYHPCAVDIIIKKGWIEQRHLAWLDRAQDVARDSCLARMEAAMRRMDTFRPSATIFVGRAYEKGAIDKETFRKWEHEVELVMKEWDEVKRDCWTHTP